jgi:hypothetical protein
VNNTFACVCKDGYEEPDCLRKNLFNFSFQNELAWLVSAQRNIKTFHCFEQEMFDGHYTHEQSVKELGVTFACNLNLVNIS